MVMDHSEMRPSRTDRKYQKEKASVEQGPAVKPTSHKTPDPAGMLVASNLRYKSTSHKIDPQRTRVPKLQMEAQQIL